jgi:hypothetical protein
MTRGVLGLLLVVGALVVAPASAFADISNVSVTVTPSTKAAGAHPDVTVAEAFTYSDASDSAKTTTLHFPPGLIGNPLATPLCTQAQFHADACPANTQLGTTTVTATVSGLVQTPADGSIYNVVPTGNAPAMLGIVVRPLGGLLGKTFLTSVISLRTATDFGIDSVVDNMPNSTSGMPTVINNVSLTLKGMVAGKPFMTNPTSCKVATTVLDVVTHEGGSRSASNAFTPTDCDKLPFKPQVSATMGGPGGTNVTQRVPFTATISQADGEAAQASASVTLPVGVGLSTSGATALCSDTQLAADQCPAGSHVGTGTISTPLLAAPVSGPVYEVAGGNGLPGVAVKFGGTLPFTLVGKAAIVGGRVQNVFNGLPDVPLSTFTLAIDGGPHGILTASQDLCTGPKRTVTGVFGAQSGISATVTAPVAVVGCPLSASASGRGFRGKRPRLSVVVTKAPNGAALRSVSIKLPKNVKVVRSRGVSVRSASALPKGNWKLRRSGTLSMTLPGSGASRVAVRLSAGSIRATSKLLRTLKRHRSAAMDLTVKVVDTTGHTTSIPLDFDAKR